MKDTRIRFAPTPFSRTLKRRVDAYFEETGQSKRDVGSMYLKTAILLGTWAGCWAVFMAFGASFWVTVPVAVLMGLAMAGLGMAVQHDGGHRAYSANKRVNAAMARVLDLMGSSSYIWNQKHNIMHHTYPNVVGADDDIDIGFLARMAPEAERRGFHRWQHLYMWPLYGFIGIKWHWWDDFYQLAVGRVGDHPFPRPKGTDRWVFWLGKVQFFTWALVLPLVFHSVGAALTFYLVSQVVLGLTLAITFQMAHCVEEADYFVSPADGEAVKLDFTAHQLATTVDFATTNRLATWYMGGLNFQAVHHAFPRICHVHYSAIAPIVAETCREFGVPYKVTPTLRQALRSHYRWLRTLGREDAVQPAVAPAPPAEQMAVAA